MPGKQPFRTRLKKERVLNSTQRARIRLWAQMIDHGYAFNGPQWCYQDSPLQGLYFSVHLSTTKCDPLSRLNLGLKKPKLFRAKSLRPRKKEIPEEWIQGDGDELERLLEGLLRRRSRVPDLICALHRNRPVAFANWPGVLPITSLNGVCPSTLEQ